jgi:TRAP-type mannitol/chloroaromatic compound transport system substrate-binding protein
LVAQIFHPSGSTYHKSVVSVTDRIEAASGGRISIRVHGGGEIVGAGKEIEACRDGVIDMGQYGVICTGILGPVSYLIDPSGLPGGAHPIDLIAWYYAGDGEKLSQKVLDELNLNSVWVGIHPDPAELFCHSNVKLESGEDFKGTKFRTFGMWGEVLKEEYGASVISLAGDEIYEAAQRGLIDAFEYCPPSTNWPMGFHEITKYVGVPGIHSPSCSGNFAINKDTWNKLPSDLQALIKDEFAAFAAYDFMECWYLDGEAMRNYEEYGTEIVELSDEFQQEIAQKGKEFCEKFAAEDPLFKEVYENQKVFFKTFRSASELVQPKYCLFD